MRWTRRLRLTIVARAYGEDVSFWRPGGDDWAPAQVNTPLAPGDQLHQLLGPAIAGLLVARFGWPSDSRTFEAAGSPTVGA